jgi:ketosteroid isomerase-like protein
MYSWIIGRILRVLIGRLNAGDARTLARTFADDGHLVFPGRSSFAGDHHGRAAIEAWLARFASLSPHFELHEVAAAGPPWNLRLFFRFSDRIPIPGGGEYRNEGTEFLRIRWGRTREQRVYLDTEKVADLDARLEAAGQGASARAEPTAAPASPS